jgi:hypothetical protein
LVRKKPLVLLRYFLRRARRLVPRFTRAMGFSFGFPVAQPFRGEDFAAPGSILPAGAKKLQA